MNKLLTLALFTLLSVKAAAQSDIHVAKYFGNRKAAVSYTFDDGLAEHYTKVFPELKKRGLHASFCIIGSKVGRDMKGTPCMTWEQLKEMAADGQEITSHGWAHKNVSKLSDEALRYEVQHNDTTIYIKVGVFPRTYFYPGNRKTSEAVAFCSHDRVGTRTSQVSIGSKRNTAWLRSWVDTLLAKGTWGVGMTHGITRGYDAFGDEHTLWSHLDYVCTLRDSLWVATFHDVAAYAAERDAVSLKVRRSKGKTIVRPTMRLDKAIFNHPLTLVVPVALRRSAPTTATQDGRTLTVRMTEGKAIIDFDPNGGKIVIRNSSSGEQKCYK